MFVAAGDSPLSAGTEAGVVVRKIMVDLGVAVDGLIQVRGDLNEGDLVVVAGNERLTDGVEVSVLKINEFAVPESTSSSK